MPFPRIVPIDISGWARGSHRNPQARDVKVKRVEFSPITSRQAAEYHEPVAKPHNPKDLVICHVTEFSPEAHFAKTMHKILEVHESLEARFLSYNPSAKARHDKAMAEIQAKACINLPVPIVQDETITEPDYGY